MIVEDLRYPFDVLDGGVFENVWAELHSYMDYSFLSLYCGLVINIEMDSKSYNSKWKWFKNGITTMLHINGQQNNAYT